MAGHFDPVAGWFETLLDTTADHAVILTDTAGRVVDWLGAAERTFGYSKAETLGRDFAFIFTPEDVQRGLDRQETEVALATGKSEDDRWHVRKDGSRFWGSGVLTLLPAVGNRPTLLCKLVRDRTDVRYQIESLQNLLAARDQEIEQGKRFLASTAHELNNPLNPMSMAIELLRRLDGSVAVEQSARILRTQLSVLTALVRDLARAAGPGSFGTQIDVQRVNLHQELSATCHAFAQSSSNAQVELRLLLPSVEIWIAADPARLSQMTSNLIGNALKYTLAGGHVNVTASVEADMAVVRIEDDGIGMSDAVLPHVFELFTREGAEPHVEGLGVGLAVVHRLARQHGGSVEARSAGRGKGSSFALRLPLWGPRTRPSDDPFTSSGDASARPSPDQIG